MRRTRRPPRLAAGGDEPANIDQVKLELVDIFSFGINDSLLRNVPARGTLDGHGAGCGGPSHDRTRTSPGC